MSIDRSMGPSPHCYDLLELTESIHGVLSIIFPLTKLWKGKEHGKPGSSKSQLSTSSRAPALGL